MTAASDIQMLVDGFGALGALAFGIGTSEVEHVLATQCLVQDRPKTFRVNFSGRPQRHVTAKDFILKFIGEIGTAGGTGYVFEFVGDAVRALSMESRMTLCNMAIEAGARAGMIAPDEITFNYISLGDRPYAPKGLDLEKAMASWKTLATEEGAHFHHEYGIDVSSLAPQVTWGTNPAMVTDVSGIVPDPKNVKMVPPPDAQKALEYMGLKPGTRITEIPIDVVFIGSCTNGRIEDLRAAVHVMKGHKVSPRVQTLIVPGSDAVRRQAEAEGLDRVFKEAGAEWRLPGCSMCLAMNPDTLKPGQRCASTSNRNFEGRQGKGGRTHLVSPEMAAAAAIEGHFVDIRKWQQ